MIHIHTHFIVIINKQNRFDVKIQTTFRISTYFK